MKNSNMKNLSNYRPISNLSFYILCWLKSLMAKSPQLRLHVPSHSLGSYSSSVFETIDHALLYSIVLKMYLVCQTHYFAGSSPISLTAVNLFLWVVRGPKLVLFKLASHRGQYWIPYFVVCTVYLSTWSTIEFY